MSDPFLFQKGNTTNKNKNYYIQSLPSLFSVILDNPQFISTIITPFYSKTCDNQLNIQTSLLPLHSQISQKYHTHKNISKKYFQLKLSTFPPRVRYLTPLNRGAQTIPYNFFFTLLLLPALSSYIRRKYTKLF